MYPYSNLRKPAGEREWPTTPIHATSAAYVASSQVPFIIVVTVSSTWVAPVKAANLLCTPTL